MLALLLIAGSAACQEKIDITKEEEAIKAALKEEIALYLDGDYISEADFMKKADYVRKINNSGNIHDQTVGWDSIFVGLKKISEMESWSDVTNLKIENKDFNIKVYDKVAWAVYYVQNTGEYKEEPFDITSSRVTFLEKVGENWKIVLMTTTVLDQCETEDEDDDEENDDEDETKD